MMKFTGPASAVQQGDTVTYCGATFVAQSVSMSPSGLHRFEVVGSYPQFIDGEREVTIERLPKPEKPFYVYTRFYKKNGDCDKRIHRFNTRKQQSAFMWRTNRAITAHN